MESGQSIQRCRSELMSPAGGWPQLRAAIEAGADAVYFGLDHFSARAKVGFSHDELPDVVHALHERGVKGFVTFNTLVFDHELHRAEQAIESIARSGADAIIVQDTGIARLASQIAPGLSIHGSTQMSITSAQGAEMAARLGCSRVVLGRELSLVDIRRIRGATDMELEVFVHGALCVSYSGQCFSSEAWGGRSANRGQCAQACRLAYDLVVDGNVRDTGPWRYLLSPGDLFALEQVPELVDAGIACLKIEGRYKDANYVAATTAAYRQAIDAAWERRELKSPEATRDQLEQIYSRGLGPWFIAGTDHQSVVRGRAPRHRGQLVATVSSVNSIRNSVCVLPHRELRAGDGIVFDAADWRSPDQPEEGGNIYAVTPTDHDPPQMSLEFGHRAIDFRRIRRGDLVWRTSDPQLLVQLKPLARRSADAGPARTHPVDLDVVSRVGQPLLVTAKINSGHCVTIASDQPVAAARQQGLDESRLREQLGRLGGTPFYLGKLTLTTEPDAPGFLPMSQLNRLRREFVGQLLELRTQLPDSPCITSPAVDQWFADHPRRETTRATERAARLHLLVRTADQLDSAIRCRPDSITLDYLELYGLRPAVDQIREAGIQPRVASPRILKPNEQNVIRFLHSLDCAVLVRSAGLLHDLLALPESDRPRLIGDFSLNVANVVSANLLLDLGLQFITPTWDLNALQIRQLTAYTDPDRLEIIAFGHLPVFHTEHCVFCRFLSDGTDNTNCGHPCETHRVALQDGQNRLHPVMADVGCRNTVFGAQAQVATGWLQRWQSAGLREFRLEFVHESAAEVQDICQAFRKFFDTGADSGWLAGQLQAATPGGTTEGSFFVPRRGQ